jgi:hypothetical protein
MISHAETCSISLSVPAGIHQLCLVDEADFGKWIETYR